MCRVSSLSWLKVLISCLLIMLSVSFCSNGGGDDDDDSGDDDDDNDSGDDDDDSGDDDDDTGDDDSQDGCIEGEFLPYLGVLHAHTSYSDGELTPADAFAHGRDVGGLDILVITDHLEQLYFPLPPNRWGLCREQADAADDPGDFLADCGFEYGSGFILPFFQSTGHNNVFFSEDLFPMIQLDFHDFYDSLVACETCIGQFNHPGDDETMDWNDWEYFPEVDRKMNFYEFNGGGPTWEMFFEVLDAGWRVSPVYNQDNHGADWGSKNDRRAGYFLEELTRESLHEAMNDRRSFMSYDKNASLRLMALDACWMGSILTGYDSLTLDAEADDLDEGDGFTTLELFGPGQTLLDTVDCGGETYCVGYWEPQITEPTYFVVRAFQTDGEWLVSAPIWVAP